MTTKQQKALAIVKMAIGFAGAAKDYADNRQRYIKTSRKTIKFTHKHGRIKQGLSMAKAAAHSMQLAILASQPIAPKFKEGGIVLQSNQGEYTIPKDISNRRLFNDAIDSPPKFIWSLPNFNK